MFHTLLFIHLPILLHRSACTYKAKYNITCSTVVLCYRRQAIPMEQGKIRPSVTLYTLNRSLSNLVWLITSATPTHTPMSLVLQWWNSTLQIWWNGEFLWFQMCNYTSPITVYKILVFFAPWTMWRIFSQLKECSKLFTFNTELLTEIKST